MNSVTCCDRTHCGDKKVGVSNNGKLRQFSRTYSDMKRRQAAASVFLLSLLSICLAGCSNKFWEPTDIGRFRPVPAVNVILDSLGIAEETPSAWEGAEEPRPIDAIVFDTDYVFNAGDIVRISIFELLQEGMEFESDYIVTETGKISIPEVGVVEAAGLTESQLEEEIRQILAPSILKEPSVTVILLSSQQRMFSIIGEGVPRPDRYSLPRYDFMLTDALARAGGLRQFNVSYIYVSRPVTGKETQLAPLEPEITAAEVNEPEVTAPEVTVPEVNEPEITVPEVAEPQVTKPELIEAEITAPEVNEPEITFEPEAIEPEVTSAEVNEPEVEVVEPEVNEPEQPREPIEPEKELLEIIAPRAQGWSGNKIVIASAEMITNKELAEAARLRSSGSPTEKREVVSAAGEAKNEIQNTRDNVQNGVNEREERIEWIFKDGQWVPVQVGRLKPAVKPEPEKAIEPLRETKPEEFDWDEIGAGGVQMRVIKIPVDRLLGGDPRYNIVIRPGDSIHVPVDIIGEFCIMGNVNNQGYIDLTGRPMTLKMAIAAAGGLGQLAWPKRCEVIRRISRDKEEIVSVDLDKIAMGLQPDFFIKPNDLINVGTHPTSRWRAVLRNAFRATYGFGLTYDRNFAYASDVYSQGRW